MRKCYCRDPFQVLPCFGVLRRVGLCLFTVLRFLPGYQPEYIPGMYFALCTGAWCIVRREWFDPCCSERGGRWAVLEVVCHGCPMNRMATGRAYDFSTNIHYTKSSNMHYD